MAVKFFFVFSHASAKQDEWEFLFLMMQQSYEFQQGQGSIVSRNFHKKPDIATISAFKKTFFSNISHSTNFL